MTSKLKHKVENNTLIFERIFDAPRELVFKCWTDQEMIREWWVPGPGWTVPFSKMNLEVGGTWHYMMKGPDDGSQYANMESWGISTYKEIDPPSKLVLVDSFTDDSGIANESMPTSQSTIEFIEQDGKTLMRSSTIYSTEQELQQVIEMGMLQGCENTYVSLDTLLEKLQQN